jgi:hypothetical protein
MATGTNPDAMGKVLADVAATCTGAYQEFSVNGVALSD